jgi:predicted acylesterase/phospholipase RssA
VSGVAQTATTQSPDQVAEARRHAQELRDTTYPTTAEVALECDLVMKGGVSSGVVYPLAACELARTRRFVNIGGSSAGAIAACMVAAAECGRDTGGFNRLAALPEEIGPTLPKLFTSGPHTKTAHAALMAWLDPKASRPAKIRRVTFTLLRSQWRRVVLGWLLAVVIAIAAAFALVGSPDDGVAIARFVAVIVVIVGVGMLLAATWALAGEVDHTQHGMTAQGFGLCVGSNGPAAQLPTQKDPGALTDWLSARIDSIAGVERPLLVGDLGDKSVNLQVMTTNLTQGRPMCFPFTEDRFLFDPVELGTYFPPKIIEALIDSQLPAPARDGVEMVSVEGKPLYWLPASERLPVVLAARISLSFPGLISAVPLYVIDNSRLNPADRKPVRCWFSDGGITSNFPIHFFDSFWPRRPTFALDLRGYHPDHPHSDVYYSATARREPSVTVISTLRGFFAAILDTMEYWADDAQSTLPGYRDRIVEVHLHSEEGGMNLEMPADVIATVADKGRKAAIALDEGFDFDRHRWTRYLNSMGRLQDAVASMDARYGPSRPGLHDGVRDLIEHADRFPPYDHPHDWSVKARDRTEDLLHFAIVPEPDFSQDAPQPVPTLRITPRF